ncbi:collagen alpha-1(III) chain-like [Moschus berezovskii]|uniref:collagen alpha-1(III) chain-like n=1 Tax=Moschus berezovskii TaxID=68408 RepID=UPI002443C553|nr:collagen alpha-1(III) chain-like [Moschus berezovskii]
MENSSSESRTQPLEVGRGRGRPRLRVPLLRVTAWLAAIRRPRPRPNSYPRTPAPGPSAAPMAPAALPRPDQVPARRPTFGRPRARAAAGARPRRRPLPCRLVSSDWGPPPGAPRTFPSLLLRPARPLPRAPRPAPGATPGPHSPASAPRSPPRIPGRDRRSGSRPHLGPAPARPPGRRMRAALRGRRERGRSASARLAPHSCWAAAAATQRSPGAAASAWAACAASAAPRRGGGGRRRGRRAAMAGGGRAPGQPVSRGSTFPAARRAGVRRRSGAGPGSGRPRAGLLGAAAERGRGGCGARVRAPACPRPRVSLRLPPGSRVSGRGRGAEPARPRPAVTGPCPPSSRAAPPPPSRAGRKFAAGRALRPARVGGARWTSGAGRPAGSEWAPVRPGPQAPRGLGGAVRQPRARAPRRPARGLSRVSRFPWPLRGLRRGPGPGGRWGWRPRGAIGRPRGGDCDSGDPRPFRDHRDSPEWGREELRRPPVARSCPWFICGVLGPRPLKERGVCFGGRGPSLQPASLGSGGAALRAAPQLSEPRPVLRVCAGAQSGGGRGPAEKQAACSPRPGRRLSRSCAGVEATGPLPALLTALQQVPPRPLLLLLCAQGAPPPPAPGLVLDQQVEGPPQTPAWAQSSHLPVPLTGPLGSPVGGGAAGPPARLEFGCLQVRGQLRRDPQRAPRPARCHPGKEPRGHHCTDGEALASDLVNHVAVGPTGYK